MPRAVVVDDFGRAWDVPGYGMLVRHGDVITWPDKLSLIPLPAGSQLMVLPGRRPVARHTSGRVCVIPRAPGGGPAWAAAVALPQGYTRTYLPAARRDRGGSWLPLRGYAAVGAAGEMLVAAVPTDDPFYWDPRQYNTPDLPDVVASRLASEPGNDLLAHLGHCALHYGCFTAQNIFYRRWEGGIPLASRCNARCLGCLSGVPAGGVPAAQERLTRPPGVKEIVAVAVPHLEQAPKAIISFGQGCEGEPTLELELLAAAIKAIRKDTRRGTLNVNTNAGRPEAIERLANSGLDSLRVTLFSARPEVYLCYHRPRGFGLDEVIRSLKVARGHGLVVALNLLVFPGVTDREEEVEALLDLVQKAGINQVQMRNLNIDPDLLLARLPRRQGKLLGIPGLIEALTGAGVPVGSYTHPAEEFRK